MSLESFTWKAVTYDEFVRALSGVIVKQKGADRILVFPSLAQAEKFDKLTGNLYGKP